MNDVKEKNFCGRCKKMTWYELWGCQEIRKVKQIVWSVAMKELYGTFGIIQLNSYDFFHGVLKDIRNVHINEILLCKKTSL